MNEKADRCLKCKRRLKRQALEIGTGYCNACGHAVFAAAATRARRVGNVRLDALITVTTRLEREQLERARTAHERFTALLTPIFN